MNPKSNAQITIIICFVALFFPFRGSRALAGHAQRVEVPDTVESFPVGHQPRGVAFDGANIWVTSDTTTSLTKLRASDGAVFDGTYVWVTNPYDNTVSRVRTSDG